ncbi:MAG TPA: efflux RND transporter periplasmic adaptor subunit [Candidatus Binatia bacterium]|nr:efflux RND transporter periplasmic adaptor subunit [Candidatus Binatia bacterium]
MRTVLLLVGLAACLAGCGRHDGIDATAAAAEGQLTPAQMSFLRFTPATEVATADVADVAGTIEFDEERTARLSAPIAGRVTELLVHIGDRVDADAPLVAIDSPEVKAAQAEFVRAEADARLTRKAAERSERLKAARAIAEKDWQQATEDALKAGADLDRAHAQLERLHVTPGDPSSRYVLRAPFAGTVVERRAAVGMETGGDSADPLVVVSDLSRVRVNLRVPERQLGLVTAGARVAVRVDAYPQDFPGTILAVGDVVDDTTRTVPVRCTVPNPDRLLKPAMFARVTLKGDPTHALLVVPTAALLSDGEKFRVLVRTADGGLESRRVEVGVEVDGRVQVLSGLRAGEQVVSEGAIFAARQMESQS